jgi:hypothetical protein
MRALTAINRKTEVNVLYIVLNSAIVVVEAVLTAGWYIGSNAQ